MNYKFTHKGVFIEINGSIDAFLFFAMLLRSNADDESGMMTCSSSFYAVSD